MLGSIYYGFWDYWELRHKVTFDGPNRLILINNGVTNLDVQTDIYSDWKEWAQYENNLKYFTPFSTVGGDPTVAGQRLDVTYFLINGWKIKPYSGTYNLDIIGNIFDVNGEDIKVPADVISNKPNNITVNLNTSVIVRQLSGTTSSTSGSGLTTAENEALFNIEGKVIAIETLLQAPVTASLVTAQLNQLSNIENISYSSSLEISSLSDNSVSQSLYLYSLTDVNASQSLQLNSLTETNVTQSQQLTSLTNINYSQSLQLSELQNKLIEVWQLHGLDISNPLLVTQTERTFSTVDQTIVTTGTGSAQSTTITRT